MSKYDISKDYIKYNEDVLNGKMVTGKYIKLACKRMKSWFGKDDRYFDYDDVDKKIRFMQKLRHSKDEFAGKPFILEPYQTWIVSNIIGWKYKDTGYRIISEALLVLSRKAGKTFFSSALMLAIIMTDGLPGAEGYMIANSSSQASICFNHAVSQCKSIDPDGKIFQRYRSQIRIPLLDSTIQVLASDTDKLDGFSPSVFCVDEYHAAKSTELWSVLRTGQGIRKNGLGIIISSCGFLVGDDYPLYAECSKAKRILDNLIEEDTMFAALYQLDEDDDYRNEDVWLKSNPTLDVTVPRSYLREQVNTAENNKSLEVSIKTKNFGVWCQSETTWIPAESVKQVTKAFDYSDFNHSSSEYRCLVGADLAERGDLCVLSTLIHYEGKYWFKAYPFICESALEKGKNKELYQRWVREGHLICVPGKSIDIEWIVGYLMEITDDCPVMGIAYDPKFATQFCIAANKAGLPTIPVNQGLAAFSEPTSVLEHLIMTEQAVIDDNPVIRWCFANVLLKYDFNGNKKPVKSADANKIDIIIAFLQTVKMQMEIEGMNDVNLEACVLL